MKYLVYAILRESPGAEPPVAGIDGEGVRWIAAAGLTAACSCLPTLSADADMPRLLGYARTIDELARRGDLLPMRYGCWLERAEQIEELLLRRGAEFRATLDKISGCVEMGIRLLLPEDATPFTQPAWAGRSPQATATGYLAQRRGFYTWKDGHRNAADRLSAALRRGLEGLFTQWRSEEISAPEGQLLSLHFLVPTSRLAQFRQVYRQLQDTSCDRTMLSGPWPPYNFVQPEIVGQTP